MYDIQRSGKAVEQYDDLLARATAAGRGDQFLFVYDEILSALRDPSKACRVGQPRGQTQLPGGSYRDWVNLFLYVQYAIYPDAGLGFIYWISFSPQNWA